ncbi:methyl-accepting chemotaxis protein [Malonomonas rubra]|uniref:methyl-accepting chemotaxis protein n=1 Tax=Malonomonas rubra TaxID=57040 RepID=UPI0026EF9CF9|nr:methyl-accepting chemotaxis protein [Malonomonas rubra]
MLQGQRNGLSYLRKVFYFTHVMGFSAAVLFPFAVWPLIGDKAFTVGFILMTVMFGYLVAVSSYFFVRATMKKQLRTQLDMLEPLTGKVETGNESLETMATLLSDGIDQVQELFEGVMKTSDNLIPYYRSLGQAVLFLADRANEGLAAAKVTSQDVEIMETKQKDVVALIRELSSQSQDEAALSRELSQSLEEMARAMDHSTAKFIETTTAVEEMTASVREVANQAEDIARSVEETAQQLDTIGESFERIRSGSAAGNEAVQKVKQDAEEGLQMMTQTLGEIDLMATESQQAMAAMERLAHQAQEVGKIIGVIKELVGDTELLAFNAAIIAAKAGDEGKGFAVVADEIKELADRTTDSAQDIQRIIQAISKDTEEALTAVEATVKRVSQGKENSLRTGDALNQIVHSVDLASAATDEISHLTSAQGERARLMLNEAGQSLRSVRAVARAMKEQRSGIGRIQDGVTEMKSAADQVARGMDEQLRATRELDRGLTEREVQIKSIMDANSFQQQASNRITAHFTKVEDRLHKNVAKTSTIFSEIDELEKLTERLRQLGQNYMAQISIGKH